LVFPTSGTGIVFANGQLLSSYPTGGGPTDRLVSGSYQVILSGDGNLSVPGAIVTASNSKLDLVGFGPNTAYLTTTPDDTTALFMGLASAELYAHTNVQIRANTGGISQNWTFGADGSLTFPDNTTQTTAFTGNPDSSNWDSTYSTVKNTSANWNAAYTNLIYNSAAYLSGTAVDLGQIPSLSANWNNTYTQYSSNSASYATIGFVNGKFLPLSGGSITGNLVVQGSLTALGTATFANTIFTTTSALSVINTGPGPALYVFQTSGPYDVASFYDGDGVEVLHVGNATPGGNGFVGINESFPSVELSVRGAVSASKTITALGGNSNQWNAAYTNLIYNSSNYLSAYNMSLINSNSGYWNEAYTNLVSNSSNYLSGASISYVNTNFVKLSGDNMTGSLSAIMLSGGQIFSSGNLRVLGDGTFNRVQATIKNFYIEHPTVPGKHLQYSSLESPYIGVRLTGEDVVKNGKCVVLLPEYTKGLISEKDVHVFLTNHGHSKVLYVDSINIKQNQFTVKCDALTNKWNEYKFFWSLTGVRKDVPNLEVEV
jgi:hypothetical protein